MPPPPVDGGIFQLVKLIPPGQPIGGAHQLEEVQRLVRDPRGQHLLSSPGALLHPRHHGPHQWTCNQLRHHY